MKLIIKEYLGALRERGELDVILPDLLSQLGLNVFSRPGRGTRQDGVDVAAVGKLEGKKQKVYLFTIKPGDLTRSDWARDAPQEIRPSLTEILDAYIPNRLPSEHADKDIVVCICIGGDIQEQVVPALEGFIKQHQSAKVSFEKWNGDKLASLIEKSFLREDLLPQDARPRLRKSLAMLDEPDTSFTHFVALIRSLTAVEDLKDAQRLRAIRQMGICLGILFAWSRDVGNLESAYRSSELTLLHAWTIAERYAGKKTKAAKAVLSAFSSIQQTYEDVTSAYLLKCVLPHVDKRDGLSSAVHGGCALDINLKMFDVLGRLAVKALWRFWAIPSREEIDSQSGIREELLDDCNNCAQYIKELISNNTTLFSPIKDDQCIDISIATLFLAIREENRHDINKWLKEIVSRAKFSYMVHGRYPCNLHSYSDLLEHPAKRDAEYQKSVTSGSVLYPTISLLASLLRDTNTYSEVSDFKTKLLSHCNFQLWYPDDASEKHLYTNSDLHGGVLSGVCVERSESELLEQIFSECDKSPRFDELSAVKYGFWPLIIVACRHYRLPVPPHFWRPLRELSATAEG